MEQKQEFIARVIYHHRTKKERQVTLIAFRERQGEQHLLLHSDCCYEQPECWGGMRAEVLEQWRHLNRSLQSEWFLYDKMTSNDPDFAESV